MGKKMKILTFAAPPELVDALEAISRREYIPVSVIIRSNLLKALEEEIKKAKEEQKCTSV